MELACAAGLNGKNWIASNGTHAITAKIEALQNNDLNNISNTCEAQLIIPNGKLISKEVANIIEKNYH
jgi:cellobiose-specific phosphotransferase system component IIB